VPNRLDPAKKRRMQNICERNRGEITLIKMKFTSRVPKLKHIAETLGIYQTIKKLMLS
jgi:hypothetical protein